MMDAFYNKDVTKIEAEVNTGSLIDYLIVDMIMGEHDHHSKSFNMYYTNTSSDDENGKLSFGPIWDYDWSLNVNWTGTPNEIFEISNEMFYSNIFFEAMRDIPEYYEQIKIRYNEYGKVALANYIVELDTIVASMEESLYLNHKKWYSAYSTDITSKNIKFLKDYLQSRKTQLDSVWTLE